MHKALKTGIVVSMWTVIAGVALVGCATPPTVRTQTAPGANLSQYRTYDYFDKLSTDRKGYTTIMTRSIQSAIDREMQARGFTRAPNPDIKVNFNVVQRDKVTTVPGAGPAFGFGGWRGGFGYGWGGGFVDTREVETITEGTLTVDLVDRAKKELMWTGSATHVVDKAGLDHPQRAVDSAVTAIFAKYPVGAGSAAPNP